jgi:hypothetical protein
MAALRINSRAIGSGELGGGSIGWREDSASRGNLIQDEFLEPPCGGLWQFRFEQEVSIDDF